MHLGQRVRRAVLVVLCGDPGERVRLVAIALEIALGDLTENAGKPAFDPVFLLAVAGAEQNVADLRARHLGHLLDADDQSEPRLLGGNRVQPLVDCRRTGGAGILDPGRRLEAKAGIGLKHERGREFLADKAAVHRAEKDRVDIGRGDPGIGERRLRRLDDQRLNVLVLVLAEFRMRPAHDAPAHPALR